MEALVARWRRGRSAETSQAKDQLAAVTAVHAAATSGVRASSVDCAAPTAVPVTRPASIRSASSVPAPVSTDATARPAGHRGRRVADPAPVDARRAQRQPLAGADHGAGEQAAGGRRQRAVERADERDVRGSRRGGRRGTWGASA